MIKPAFEIRQITNLDSISEAIEKAAKEGWHSLSLYKQDYQSCFDSYSRLFQYSEKDLDKLKNLGYKVDIVHSQTVYSGMLWWKKPLFTVDYHRISW
jgi:hypothetical protein